jgi:hypothetical protein
MLSQLLETPLSPRVSRSFISRNSTVRCTSFLLRFYLHTAKLTFLTIAVEHSKHLSETAKSHNMDVAFVLMTLCRRQLRADRVVRCGRWHRLQSLAPLSSTHRPWDALKLSHARMRPASNPGLPRATSRLIARAPGRVAYWISGGFPFTNRMCIPPRGPRPKLQGSMA